MTTLAAQTELHDFLTTMPGRCPECAWHIEKQGHARGCSNRNEGQRRGAAGMARASAAHPGDVELVDAAIAKACAIGQPFSANDFRHLVPDLEEPNVIGSQIRSWLSSRRIKRVGDEPSSLPGTHAHRIGLYVPT